MNPQNQETAAAWSLVLQYSDYIEKIGRKLFGAIRRPEDREEARQEFILHLVEHVVGAGVRGSRLSLEGARDRKAVVQSWIYFQGMAVQKKMSRRFGKMLLERSGHFEGGDDEELSSVLDNLAQSDASIGQGGEWGSLEQFARLEQRRDAQVMVEAVMGQATPKEREALMAKLLDLDAAQMRARYGISTGQANQRLVELRARVTLEGTEALIREERLEAAAEKDAPAPVAAPVVRPVRVAALAPASPPPVLVRATGAPVAVPVVVVRLAPARLPSRAVLAAVVGRLQPVPGVRAVTPRVQPSVARAPAHAAIPARITLGAVPTAALGPRYVAAYAPGRRTIGHLGGRDGPSG